MFIWNSHHLLPNILSTGACKQSKRTETSLDWALQQSLGSREMLGGKSWTCPEMIQHQSQSGAGWERVHHWQGHQHESPEPRLGKSSLEGEATLKMLSGHHSQNSRSTKRKSQACKIIKCLYFSYTITVCLKFCWGFGLFFCTQSCLVTITWIHMIS